MTNTIANAINTIHSTDFVFSKSLTRYTNFVQFVYSQGDEAKTLYHAYAYGKVLSHEEKDYLLGLSRQFKAMEAK